MNAAEFLQAPTQTRLKLALEDANSPELFRLLGAPAYAELRELAEKTFDGSHFNFDEPKNLIFVPGVMGSLLMKAGIWWR